MLSLRRVINDFPSHSNAIQAYEKEQASVLIKSAKVLYDNARVQILQALVELDKRKAYWSYQKNHQWKYFITKNPIKWVTGQSQQQEIENNLEQIQSHQGELYVLLGQLVQLGAIYDEDNKTLFVADYTKGYDWIDKFLELLPRLHVIGLDASDNHSPFLARAVELRLKLARVNRFEEQLLSDVQDTTIPSHAARNWLKYTTMLYLFGQAYQRADQIGEWALSFIDRSKNYLIDIAMPVKEMFFPGIEGKNALIVKQENINAALLAMQTFLDRLQNKKVITAQEKDIVINDTRTGSSAEFQKLLNKKIMSKGWNKFLYGAEGWSIFLQLLALLGGGNIEKEIVGLRNIALLAPVGIVGWVGYSGLGSMYQRFASQDYRPIARSLLDVNSLFVDQTRPLDDERYGKMVYLLYNLKNRVKKELPQNVREDFLHDLEMIELKEFDIAAKRRIVEDMFKKYSFLRLHEQK